MPIGAPSLRDPEGAIEAGYWYKGASMDEVALACNDYVRSTEGDQALNSQGSSAARVRS